MPENLLFELPPEIEACDTVVIYDERSGAIRHTHNVFTWRGATHPTREEIEKEAMEEARRAGVELRGVATLRIDPREVEADALHRVDVRERRLVASRVRRGRGRARPTG
ncbi:MAG: hypothetical protein R3325_03410 [Thermoanaerobaculia bacterium]|nr:hypothetical protein [Thermoanaerobaculia bacterium]